MIAIFLLFISSFKFLSKGFLHNFLVSTLLQKVYLVLLIIVSFWQIQNNNLYLVSASWAVLWPEQLNPNYSLVGELNMLSTFCGPTKIP